MFNLSDDLKKLKTKALIVSSISLFIALTEALPQKVAILGLDLSKNETIVGWFVLVITVYFLISFLIYSIIEIIQYYLPTFIERKTENTTGDTIGLTAEECFPNQDLGNTDEGTVSGELNDIKRTNQKITYKYTSNFISFSDFTKLTTEIIFPIVFGFTSLGFLYCFLTTIQ